MDIREKLCKEFPVKPDHMENIISLIDDGNTIPFIARYRKEMHGSCDDQLLREIADRLQYLRNLEKKKEDYIAHIEELGKMTEELRADILAAETLAVLEDLYRPYKQKRRTRATIAKEKGLEPLALEILAQERREGTIEEMAEGYISEEKDVPDVAAALQGANDIIAEIMSDSPEIRHDLKEMISAKGIIRSKAKTEEDSVYSMYYDYSEAVSKIPSHRILALNRGENEDFLKVVSDFGRV